MKIKLILPFLLCLVFGCGNDDNETEGYEIEDNLVTLTGLNNDLNESSGLLLSDNILWTHNDSGDDPKIYSIPENSADIIEKVTIINATNTDWEDLAQNNTHIYIGDFGNNSGERQDLTIYKIPKSGLPGDVEAETIRFIFSDQTSFDNQNAMHNFDCEAMICIDEELYLFSKNHIDNQTKLYRLPNSPGVHVAERISSFDVDGLVTSAGIDKIGNTLCLLGYNQNDLIFDPFVWIFYNYTGTDFFSGSAKRVNLPIQTQMEGICFKGNGEFLISSENENGTVASLFLFDAQKWK